MTDELPAQWALDKAAAVAGYRDWGLLAKDYDSGTRLYEVSIALARYIEKHEPAPVDPDLELARECAAEHWAALGESVLVNRVRSGDCDEDEDVQCALIAIRKLKERGK